jgi:ribosome maturation factor RimP
VGEGPLFYFVEKMVSIATRAESLVRTWVEAEGFELVHIEYRSQGGKSVLRVFIDKVGGVNISDCAEISRRLSVLLDVEDPIPGEYVLEVSSPGVERPLFKEDDYRRAIGKEVRLSTIEKIEARKNFVGHIRDFANHVLTLECEARTYLIPFQKIRKAKLVYRF